MATRSYPWRRVWYQRESRPLLDADGFLVDSDSLLATLGGARCLPFEKYSQHRCLVLLGEAGSGKTFALRGFSASAPDKDQEGPARHIVDLGAFSSDAGITRAIFDAQWWKQWVSGSHQLEVFLDSLDECRARLPNVPRLLIEELQSAPIDRLALRVACRTAEWPEFFGERLAELWGASNFAALEIAPLTMPDVSAACELNKIDASAFLAEVRSRGLGMFAAKPITLDFLISRFGVDRQLPDNLTALYEDGIATLCADSSERVESNAQPLLSPHHAVAVAARIAAAVVLGNTGLIDTSDKPGVRDGIPLRALAGGTEVAFSETINVGLVELKDVVKRAVFTSAGPEHRTFVHRTYAEFLAARFIAMRLTLGQIWNIVAVPYEGKLSVPPQMEGLVGWLASRREDLRHEVLHRQPEVLLRGDIATGDPAIREHLVEELLKSIGDHKITNWLQLWQDLWKLDHRGLADQLRPIIKNSAEAAAVRQGAIDIAEKCRCRDLTGQLALVALDPKDADQVRVAAARAISAIGDSDSRNRIKPLAFGHAGPDPLDEMRGYAIRATWPTHLTPAELFACLGRPKVSNLMGPYKWLLHEAAFARDLNPDGVLVALDWIVAQNIGNDPLDDLRDCAGKLVAHAWQYCEQSPISIALARVFLDRLRRYDNLWFERSNHTARRQLEVGKRRAVFACMVSMADVNDNLVNCLHGDNALVDEADFDWVLANAVTQGSDEHKRWAKLLAYFPMTPASLESAFPVYRQSAELEEALGPWFRAVSLDSPQADGMKERYSWESRSAPPSKLLDPPPGERVRAALERCASGAVTDWWRLCRELTLLPTSEKYEAIFNCSVTAAPGWKEADADRQELIVAAAKRVVSVGKPSGGELKPGTVSEGDYSAYLAFRLLLEKDIDAILGLQADAWSAWLPGLMSWPLVAPGEPEANLHSLLLRVAYLQYPVEFLAILIKIIELEDLHHKRLNCVDAITTFIDAGVLGKLRQCVEQRYLGPAPMGQLFAVLAQHGDTDTVRKFVTEAGLKSEPERSWAIEAAQRLLSAGGEHVWSHLRDLMIKDVEWGKRVVEGLCHNKYPSSSNLKLTEEQVGQLLDWLLVEYPPASDSQDAEAHYIGPDESVRMWRDQLILYLQNLGTGMAIDSLAKLRDTHPELPGLYWSALLAKRVKQAKDWRPVPAQALLDMVLDQDRRYVASAAHLIEVVVRSLERLQAKLHGETPRVEFLWDGSTQRPKLEKSLSNYVKGHLEDDLRGRGVVVGREVEIRQRLWTDGDAGERVDLHIDAADADGHVVTAIVEVKGCWNDDLMTSLRDQLVDRYLKTNADAGGIYLVGWYLCDAWDDGDPKKSKVPFGEITECIKVLDEQAAQCAAAAQREVQTVVLDCRLN